MFDQNKFEKVILWNWNKMVGKLKRTFYFWLPTDHDPPMDQDECEIGYLLARSAINLVINNIYRHTITCLFGGHCTECHINSMHNAQPTWTNMGLIGNSQFLEIISIEKKWICTIHRLIHHFWKVIDKIVVVILLTDFWKSCRGHNVV